MCSSITHGTPRILLPMGRVAVVSRARMSRLALGGRTTSTPDHPRKQVSSSWSPALFSSRLSVVGWRVRRREWGFFFSRPQHALRTGSRRSGSRQLQSSYELRSRRRAAGGRPVRGLILPGRRLGLARSPPRPLSACPSDTAASSVHVRHGRVDHAWPWRHERYAHTTLIGLFGCQRARSSHSRDTGRCAKSMQPVRALGNTLRRQPRQRDACISYSKTNERFASAPRPVPIGSGSDSRPQVSRRVRGFPGLTGHDGASRRPPSTGPPVRCRSATCSTPTRCTRHGARRRQKTLRNMPQL